MLERSQQLFSGLRDVPQFGKQWQPYFQRTFEVYTKLWKFQQIHRTVLESKDKERSFSFKRCDIGEIASKIGQLYYHYYLRTSEPNYLHESCVFYEAIRARGYFKDALDVKNSGPMVKKLRYYARFIVVCLLLDKRQLVETVAAELTQHVETYVKTFRTADTQEWNFVLQEISQFLQADALLQIEGGIDGYYPSTRRLVSSPSSNEGPMRLKLQEAILVGNCQNQVKFSELTLDMFRVMQALEHVPLEGQEAWEGSGHDTEKMKRARKNPHKYLLYRPTMSQLLVFLANSFKELQDNNALFLYISADGIFNPQVQGLPVEEDAEIAEDGDVVPSSSPEAEEDQLGLCQRGGVALNSRRSPEKQQSGVTADCLYQEDLFVYTRKHLFLVIDSDNSEAFENIPTIYGRQVMALLSPKEHPADIDPSKTGNLFTLFLSDPLTAFCFIMEKKSLSQEVSQKLTAAKDDFFEEIRKLIQTYPDLNPAFALYAQDAFIQNFMVNYMFCYATLFYHKQFQHPQGSFWPKISPKLPAEFFHHRVLQMAVYDLAQIIGTSGMLVGELATE